MGAATASQQRAATADTNDFAERLSTITMKNLTVDVAQTVGAKNGHN